MTGGCFWVNLPWKNKKVLRQILWTGSTIWDQLQTPLFTPDNEGEIWKLRCLENNISVADLNITQVRITRSYTSGKLHIKNNKMPRKKGGEKKLPSTLRKNKAILIFTTKRETVRQEMKPKKTCICCKSCNLFQSSQFNSSEHENTWSKEN